MKKKGAGAEKETIFDSCGNKLAYVVRRDFEGYSAIEFVSDPGDEMQLGWMRRPKDYKVKAHEHVEIDRVIRSTSEVLFVRSGRLRLKLYGADDVLVSEHLLENGDIAMLLGGGHAIEFLEESDLIEVKQGPYVPDEKRFLDL